MADDFFDSEDEFEQETATVAESEPKLIIRDKVQIRRRLEDRLEELRLSREFNNKYLHDNDE